MSKYTSTIDRYGRTTIPVPIREKLGLKAGDPLTWNILVGAATERIFVELSKDKDVQELKGLFSHPNGKTVTVEDMDAAAEMAAWDSMQPVGREFGSQDYERLEELDNLAIQAKGCLLKARRWLDTPQNRLGGMSPEEVAKTREGFEQVKRLLVGR